MMSTAEHAAAAEGLIRSAGQFMAEGDAAAHDRCIATAQVHACLATVRDTAAMKPLLAALTALTAGWHTRAAELTARANRLGNCPAGKEAFGDSVMFRSCAEKLTATIVTALAGEDQDGCNTFSGHHS